jgi:hypothetical protein
MTDPYFIEVYDNGCVGCGAGRTWTIVRPDGCTIGISYGDFADADDVAEMLNEAYWIGRNSSKKPKKAFNEASRKSIGKRRKKTEPKSGNVAK